MTEQEEKKPQGRKSKATIRKPSRHGERTQKMMSIRIDYDVAEMMAAEPNKGRLINNLLREHYKSKQEEEQGAEKPENE